MWTSVRWLVLESELRERQGILDSLLYWIDFSCFRSQWKLFFFFLKGFIVPKSRELFLEVRVWGRCLIR